MRSFVDLFTGKRLMELVHWSGWKSSIELFLVLFQPFPLRPEIEISHSHSWRTRGRRCTRRWWHCSSSRRGRRPPLNRNRSHQGPGEPESNSMFHQQKWIRHLIPSPGSSDPELLSEGELEEEQGHPHHQQHHQEGDDERSWEKGLTTIHNEKWQFMMRWQLVSPVQKSLEVMKGTETDESDVNRDRGMRIFRQWGKIHSGNEARDQIHFFICLSPDFPHVSTSFCTWSASFSPSLLFHAFHPTFLLILFLLDGSVIKMHRNKTCDPLFLHLVNFNLVHFNFNFQVAVVYCIYCSCNPEWLYETAPMGWDDWYWYMVGIINEWSDLNHPSMCSVLCNTQMYSDCIKCICSKLCKHLCNRISCSAWHMVGIAG